MSSDDTERVAFLQLLEPDMTEGYKELHENVPAFVEEAMARAGVEDFRVFQREDVAVCVMDVTDADEYVEVMSEDEQMDGWERRANQYKRQGIDVDASPDEQIPWMEEIWHFSRDR